MPLPVNLVKFQPNQPTGDQKNLWYLLTKTLTESDIPNFLSPSSSLAKYLASSSMGSLRKPFLACSADFLSAARDLSDSLLQKYWEHPLLRYLVQRFKGC